MKLHRIYISFTLSLLTPLISVSQDSIESKDFQENFLLLCGKVNYLQSHLDENWVVECSDSTITVSYVYKWKKTYLQKVKTLDSLDNECFKELKENNKYPYFRKADILRIEGIQKWYIKNHGPDSLMKDYYLGYRNVDNYQPDHILTFNFVFKPKQSNSYYQSIRRYNDSIIKEIEWYLEQEENKIGRTPCYDNEYRFNLPDNLNDFDINTNLKRLPYFSEKFNCAIYFEPSVIFCKSCFWYVNIDNEGNKEVEMINLEIAQNLIVIAHLLGLKDFEYHGLVYLRN